MAESSAKRSELVTNLNLLVDELNGLNVELPKLKSDPAKADEYIEKSTRAAEIQKTLDPYLSRMSNYGAGR